MKKGTSLHKIIAVVLLLSFITFDISQAASYKQISITKQNLQVPVGDNKIGETIGAAYVRQIDKEIASIVAAYLDDLNRTYSDINTLIDATYIATLSTSDRRLLNVLSITLKEESQIEIVLEEMKTGDRSKFNVTVDCAVWNDITSGNGRYTVEVLAPEKDYFRIINEHIAADVIRTEKHQAIVALLLGIGQGHLFEQWEAPGTNDSRKVAFLDQLVALNETCNDGMKGSRQKIQTLLRESAHEKELFYKKYTPYVPETIDVGEMARTATAQFQEATLSGIKNADKLAIVLTAGGMANRMGYKKIPLGMPIDLVTEMTYLEWYIRNIVALQKESSSLNGKRSVKIPLAIMTSDDTHAATVDMLEENDYFGIRDQITLIQQEVVPVVGRDSGDFVLDSENPYGLKVKPHGHGNVHRLLYKSGLLKDWKDQGLTHTVFIQDTNAQVFNSIPIGLGMSIDSGRAMNFVTVPREAGERTGAIVDLIDNSTGDKQTVNVEFDELDLFLKSTGRAGDVADSTGQSPYPANLNVFFLRNDTYLDLLEEKEGILDEFIKPDHYSGDEAAPEEIGLTVAMQDIAKHLTYWDIGIINFDQKRHVFSPSKNSLEYAAGVYAGDKEIYPDTPSTAEADYYAYFRRLLADAGVDINVDGEKRFTYGVPYSEGAKIVLDSSFVLRYKVLRAKGETEKIIKGGKITDRSVLAIKGKNVSLEDVYLDGALIIDVAEGVELKIKGLRVDSDKWKMEDLSDDEMSSSETSDHLKIRGYKMVKGEPYRIEINEPGKYEIGEDGVIKKVASMALPRHYPRILRDHIEAGVIEYSNAKHMEIIDIMLSLGQGGLFKRWEVPGINDDLKVKFINQLVELNENYNGGLEKYQNNIRVLAEASMRGDNPFEGYTPEVVTNAKDFTNMDEAKRKDFDRMEQKGVNAANGLAVVLVAGGLGERLGYDGIKIGIPVELATEMTYLEWYIKNIKALQEESNRINRTDKKIPLVIMTSEGNNDDTLKLLEDNDYFGIEDQVTLMRQGAVPAVSDNAGNFLLAKKGEEGEAEGNPDDPYYKLKVKPHGHGDVHMLLHQKGLVEQWNNEGRTHTVFIQDTNAQLFNAVRAGLGVSLENTLDMNFLTSPRDAGEASGSIVNLVKKNDAGDIIETKTCNVEYNELGPLLVKTVNPLGDVPDDTGKSPYFANLNAFILENVAYQDVLDETDGLVAEFINPKYADDTRTKFDKPARAETMMQDIAKVLPQKSKVGVSNFEKLDVFSPAKNKLVAAADKHVKGNYPDSISTSEADLYKYGRKMMKRAGVDIDVEGHQRFSRDVPYSEGAKVVLDPRFALTSKKVASRVKGGRITEKSTLVIEGKDVYLNNLDLDGTLIIKIVDGAKLTIKGLKVENGGWAFSDLTDRQMENNATPNFLKVRGYELVKSDQHVIEVTEPGEWEVGEDGQLVRVSTFDQNLRTDIKKGHRKSTQLLKRVRNAVQALEASSASQPRVNIVPELSLIPEGDFEANVEMWAHLILMCGEFKNMNFIFEEGSSLSQKGDVPDELKEVLAQAPQREAVLALLEKKLKDNAVYYGHDIVSVETLFNDRIKNARSIQAGATDETYIEVPIIPIKLAEWARESSIELDANEYPVVMENPVEGISETERIMNFEAAIIVSLAKATLVIARDGNVDDLADIKRKIRARLNGLYYILRGVSIFGEEIEGEEDAFDGMISEESVHRLNCAIDAYLPARRLPISDLADYHDLIRGLLISA